MIRTDVGEVACELERVNDCSADHSVALDAEVEHAPEQARAEEAQGLLVRRVARQPEVRHPRDRRARLQPPVRVVRVNSSTYVTKRVVRVLGKREGVGGVALAAEGERFGALEEEEGREGVHRGPEVAHDVEPALDGEDGVAEVLDEAHPVVPLGRLREVGELARRSPVELACQRGEDVSDRGGEEGEDGEDVPPSITTPPRTVPWPPIHFVALCVMMSAP